MSLMSSLKRKAAALKKELSALYYAYHHPRTGLVPRIIILFTIGYAMSPVDLIPDFIPVIGYLDDIIIIPLLIALSIRLIPADVMEECRIKAIHYPMTLKNNWKFAAAILFIWVCVITIIVINVINFF